MIDSERLRAIGIDRTRTAKRACINLIIHYRTKKGKFNSARKNNILKRIRWGMGVPVRRMKNEAARSMAQH